MIEGDDSKLILNNAESHPRVRITLFCNGSLVSDSLSHI